MNYNSPNNLKIIREFVLSLKEQDLYNPLRLVLEAQDYDVWITHGSHEHGKDIIASMKKEHNLLVNVKRGNINQKRWNTEVHASLDDTRKRSVQHTNLDPSLPRRIVLALNGTLIDSIAQKIVEHNEFDKKVGQPEVEVWDINILVEKFSTYLLSVDLIGGDFLEDLQRLILSITVTDINSNYVEDFINKHLSLNVKKFLAFQLAMLYVLRRSENQNNIYAFFKFAEIALVKAWSLLHTANITDLISMFDELHGMYLESLIEWSNQMADTFQKESGLLDLTTNGSLEVITYPLRTFDVIRRLSYLAYCHFLKGDNDRVDMYAKMLLRVIRNNKAASTPVCEFNYTDIGLALTILTLAKCRSEAAQWLCDITYFLVTHYSLGYKILPLGKDMCEILEKILIQEHSHPSAVQSIMFSLIFEFSIVLDAKEVFETFKERIQNLIECYEILMPADNEEAEIYQDKVINTTYRPLPTPNSWEVLKLNYQRHIQSAKRNFSPLKSSRPSLLILLANVYRDRYFPDVWRSLFSEQVNP